MRKTTMALAVLASITTTGNAGDLWPWHSQNAPAPPKITPFELPTYNGEKPDFKAPPVALTKAPKINGDEIFYAVVTCFPSRSKWRLDVDLQAAARNTGAVDVTGTVIGQNMVGIVARMPLYSENEIYRERQQEQGRRADTASTVADFVGSIAKRNQAVRSLALAATMERRAQIRVSQGIADADEQTKWLDKTIQAESDLITAETKIAESRLKLVAMCRDDVSDSINTYLTGLTQLPETAKP